MKENIRLTAKRTLGLILTMSVMLSACRDKAGGGGLNFFSPQDDITFGAQVATEIENDPSTYPILDSAQNVASYAYLYDIRDRILSSGKVVHKDDFQWQIRLIGDDSTLNAFCTPGGYIYVYTGLIKYLDSEDQFAGVMGHEIAHADERHSTAALTRTYGIDVLLSILLGDDLGTLVQIAKGLSGLSYSRGNESESDMRSVEYLYQTDYDARGAARFFEKLEEEVSGSGPTFLSTHPNPGNRVEAIFAHWEILGAKVGETYAARYKEFQNNLP